jgi:penicillin-binding protein 2
VERRLLVLRIALVAAVAALVVRVGQLQLLRGGELRLASEQNRLRQVRLPAPRGVVTDRAGRLLVTNRPAVAVLLDADVLRRHRAVSALDELGPIVGVPGAELRRRVEAAYETFQPVVAAGDLSLAAIAQIEERLPHWPGVRLVGQPARRYPQQALAAHVLGYVREISARELDAWRDRGYHQGDGVGKAGVEKVCESALRGRDGGEQVEVDARGRPVRVLGTVAPKPGGDVALTLDAEVQRVADQALANRAGAIVAMDPSTGEVLAMASAPTFDLNLMSGAIAPEHWAYLNGPAAPQNNRAIAGCYPPGSAFKIVTACAALEAGQATEASRFFCPGYLRIADTTFHCWQRSGHGSLDFIEGFSQSCNVMFAILGRRVGAQALAAMARRFGLGATTGIDLPGEAEGLIPTPAWKEARGGIWYPGDTCQMAMGQGDVLVTPLQACREVAAIANGGHLVTPHVVRTPHSRGAGSAIGLSPATVRTVQAGLTAVVERGTARALASSSVAIAGKTGTAQNPHGVEHAWFVGYAPRDRPRVAVAVVVEHGGRGAATAAPIARRLIEAALGPPERSAP